MDAASGRTRTHGCVVDMFSRPVLRFFTQISDWTSIHSLAGLHIVRTDSLHCRQKERVNAICSLTSAVMVAVAGIAAEKPLIWYGFFDTYLGTGVLTILYVFV